MTEMLTSFGPCARWGEPMPDPAEIVGRCPALIAGPVGDPQPDSLMVTAHPAFVAFGNGTLVVALTFDEALELADLLAEAVATSRRLQDDERLVDHAHRVLADADLGIPLGWLLP